MLYYPGWTVRPGSLRASGAHFPPWSLDLLSRFLSVQSTLVTQAIEPTDEEVMREYLNQQVPPVAVPPEGASEGAWLTFWCDHLKREHGHEPSCEAVYSEYIDHQVELQLKDGELANETSYRLPDGNSASSQIHTYMKHSAHVAILNSFLIRR